MKSFAWFDKRLCAWVRKIRSLFCLGIEKRRAMKIVKAAVPPGTEIRDIYAKAPSNVNLYNAPQEPCWYVFVSWDDDDALILRSSRIILVSKATGKILYDGSACDEG